MEFTWHGRTIGNNCPPRRIDNYTFIYVESGCGRFCVGRSTYSIEKGDLFILYPGEVHEYYTGDDRPWKLLWFGLIGKDIATLMEQAGLKADSPVIKGVRSKDIPDTIHEILNLLDDSNAVDSLFALGKFLTLLGYVQVHLAGRPHADHPAQRIAQTIRFMELNFFFDIDTDLLAEQAGYTRTYYSKLFKETTGKAPMEYLIDIRLEKAYQLLCSTNLSIKEVSNSTGYEDPFYFAKAFKKRYGMTPSCCKLGQD